LKGLEELDLHDNSLEGELLPMILPSTLRVLDVEFNNLSGVLAQRCIFETHIVGTFGPWWEQVYGTIASLVGTVERN
jgi:hypothetical protein